MIFGKNKTSPESPSEADSSKFMAAPKDTPENKEPGSVQMWSSKGNTLVESSMYADAIKCYDKALEMNPGSAEVLNNKGLALARTGRLAEAIECYNKALEIKHDDAEVIFNKGIALAQLGKLAEAVDCYDKIIAANPQDAEAWCSKGDVLFQSGRLYEEALHAYRKSIEINPKDETAWNNRGMTLAKLNRYEEAIASYDKALEINPKLEKIWSNKGFAISKMREDQEKIDLQKVAITLKKDEKLAPPIQRPEPGAINKEIPAIREKPPEPKYSPVIENQVQDKTTTIITTPKPEPLATPEPVQQEKSKTSGEYLAMGNSRYSSGNYEEALMFFFRSLDIDPKNGTAWNNKGLAFVKLGRLDEAVRSYDKALEINPKDHVVLNNKGSTFYKKGLINEALQCYESALELSSDNKTAKRGIEICASSLNKLKKQ